MRIFISYSKKNDPKVKILHEHLGDILQLIFPDEVHVIWRDTRLHAGQKWWTSICTEILECELFIFVLSPDSLKSHACQNEWDYANSLQKRILPVWIDGEVQINDLWVSMRPIQYVDYRKSDAIASYQKLQDALVHLPKPLPLPDPLPPSPSEPIAAEVPSRKFRWSTPVVATIIGVILGYLSGTQNCVRDIAGKFNCDYSFNQSTFNVGIFITMTILVAILIVGAKSYIGTIKRGILGLFGKS